jgi:hypothetical protein
MNENFRKSHVMSGPATATCDEFLLSNPKISRQKMINLSKVGKTLLPTENNPSRGGAEAGEGDWEGSPCEGTRGQGEGGRGQRQPLHLEARKAGRKTRKNFRGSSLIRGVVCLAWWRFLGDGDGGGAGRGADPGRPQAHHHEGKDATTLVYEHAVVGAL